jgi:hypothetical protein
MMQSITLRQLRDTRQIKEWLDAGVQIEVRDRNRVIGNFVPRTPSIPRKVEWPDAAARRRAIFGDRIVPGADLLIEERERSRY